MKTNTSLKDGCTLDTDKAEAITSEIDRWLSKVSAHMDYTDDLTLNKFPPTQHWHEGALAKIFKLAGLGFGVPELIIDRFGIGSMTLGMLREALVGLAIEAAESRLQRGTIEAEYMMPSKSLIDSLTPAEHNHLATGKPVCIWTPEGDPEGRYYHLLRYITVASGGGYVLVRRAELPDDALLQPFGEEPPRV